MKIWPWSRIRELEARLQRKHEFQDALVHYLDSVTGDKHVALDDRLFILRPGEVMEFIPEIRTFKEQ